MVEAISTTTSTKAKRMSARYAVGDVVRARNLRIGDIVSILDTDYRFKVVTKTFFETIATPILKGEKKTDHRHRIQLLNFTQVVLLERL